MSLKQISPTASQQKRPSHLMQQHAETLFRTGARRALKLWGPAEALLHKGRPTAPCAVLSEPGQAGHDKSLSFNNLFSLIVLACTSMK